MPMSVIQLAHLTPVFRSMGGVESVLRHHHPMDASQGIESRFIVYFDDATEPVERVSSLALQHGTTPRQARQRLGAALGPVPPEIALYHGMWGMPFMVDLDRAARRILMLHGDVPDMERLMRSRSSWVDGVLCVNEPLRQFVHRCLPTLARERVGVVPYPVLPLFPPPAKAHVEGRPMVLGFCGRLVIEQKRVDRLAALCAGLDRAVIPYRLEFLGEGPERARLEREFPDRSRFIFHGRKSGAAYWRTLDGWDAILFVSDYEGTPIAMLEALNRGVVPIYPKIGSGGDDYVRGLRHDLLYEPGDIARVPETIRQLAAMNNDAWQALRSRCQQAVSGHLGESYISQFGRFVRAIQALPKVSQEPRSRRLRPLDCLPFTWLAHLAAVRRAGSRMLGR